MSVLNTNLQTNRRIRVYWLHFHYILEDQKLCRVHNRRGKTIILFIRRNTGGATSPHNHTTGSYSITVRKKKKSITDEETYWLELRLLYLRMATTRYTENLKMPKRKPMFVLLFNFWPLSFSEIMSLFSACSSTAESSPYECTSSVRYFRCSVVFGLHLRNRTFKLPTEWGLRKKINDRVLYTRLRKPYGSAGLGQNQRKYLINKMRNSCSEFSASLWRLN